MAPYLLISLAVILLLQAHVGWSFNINKGKPSSRGYIVDTIPTLAPAWYVSLEVNPYLVVHGDSNIVNFATSRIQKALPGISFISGKSQIRVCSTINGGTKCFHSSNLLLNKYSKIEVSQSQRNNGSFVFTIKIRGVKKYSIINTQTKHFANVKVYRSDPWSVPASAEVKNLVYGNLPYYHKLVRNTIFKTHPTYFGEFEVSFDVKPLGKISSFSSVLHVTKGNNFGPGHRIPAIWFRPNSFHVHICSFVSGNVNYCVDSAAPLPTNRYTNIRITQRWIAAKRNHLYKVEIDGIEIHSIVNTAPTTLANVKVYTADPWYHESNALIKNIIAETSQGGGFKPSSLREFPKIANVGKQWYLSFDVRLHKTWPAWSNVLHLTIGANIGRLGVRIPSVFFIPGSNALHICSSVGDNWNHCFNSAPLATKRFTNVRIRQSLDVKSNKYKYIITIDGIDVYSVSNNQPREFDDVFFYVSDPWYQSANATLKNVVFKNLPNGYTYDGCLDERSATGIDCRNHNQVDSFRTVDGTCNNLDNPTWGSTETQLKRIVEPAYANDGKHDTPRGFPQTNPLLPAPNEVSQHLFQIEKTNTGSEKQVTTLFMTFGQFLDHDIALTPHNSCKQKCSTFAAWQYPCFPLLFNDKTDQCSPNGRSAPVCRNDAYIGPRQHRNDLTAFVDGSQIYSADTQLFDNLRAHKDGKMKITTDGLLPIAAPRGNRSCTTLGGCSLVGDIRADENIALHSMHTLWIREHNRIASELRTGNPQWDDEQLFQTSRKITSALWQHITYEEYVPLLADVPDYTGYKKQENPSITNTFATAAFRYGHSLIPNEFAQLNNNYDKENEPVTIQEAFFNRQIINVRGIEQTMRGLVGNMSNNVDDSFSFGVARKLFVGVGGSGYLDLTALNIQRGRDHGLPGYNVYRKYCNLPVAKTWNDVADFMLPLADEKFQKIYASPDDIDIFAGGISEKHVKDLEVGPVFNCLLGQQFRSLRDGDRLFYKKRGVFTSAQRKAVKKVTMATILCNNLNGLVSIQPDVFHTPSPNNLRKECNSIPKLDLQPWVSLNSVNIKGDTFTNMEKNVFDTMDRIEELVASVKDKMVGDAMQEKSEKRFSKNSLSHKDMMVDRLQRITDDIYDINKDQLDDDIIDTHH